jgi:hypothetical protein
MRPPAESEEKTMSVRKLVKELEKAVSDHDIEVLLRMPPTYFEEGQRAATVEIVQRLKSELKRQKLRKSMRTTKISIDASVLFAFIVIVVAFAVGLLLGGRI